MESTHQLVSTQETRFIDLANAFNIVCITKVGTTVVASHEIPLENRVVLFPEAVLYRLGYMAHIPTSCPACGDEIINLSPAEAEHLVGVAGFKPIPMTSGPPIDSDEASELYRIFTGDISPEQFM